MRVDKKTKEVICRSSSKQLKEVLKKELEEFTHNLKMSSDFKMIRYYQGYVSALDDIVELLTQK